MHSRGVAEFEYDVQTGETYQITVGTDDGITGDYRWDIPPNANDRSLSIVIEQSEIRFVIV